MVQSGQPQSAVPNLSLKTGFCAALVVASFLAFEIAAVALPYGPWEDIDRIGSLVWPLGLFLLFLSLSFVPRPRFGARSAACIFAALAHLLFAYALLVAFYAPPLSQQPASPSSIPYSLLRTLSIASLGIAALLARLSFPGSRLQTAARWLLSFAGALFIASAPWIASQSRPAYTVAGLGHLVGDLALRISALILAVLFLRALRHRDPDKKQFAAFQVTSPD